MPDFTYIDDIVDGILRASDDIARPNPNWDSAHPDPATSSAPFRIFNVGNGKPVALSEFIGAIESMLGKGAPRRLLPLKPGDLPSISADIFCIETSIGYHLRASVRERVAHFIHWYRR